MDKPWKNKPKKQNVSTSLTRVHQEACEALMEKYNINSNLLRVGLVLCERHPEDVKEITDVYHAKEDILV